MTLVLVSLFLILLVLLVLRQREKVRVANAEWLASIKPLDQETIDELDDYRKNVMRFYLTDGTKLTVCKGNVIARHKYR
jgi:hypothetical protein